MFQLAKWGQGKYLVKRISSQVRSFSAYPATQPEETTKDVFNEIHFRLNSGSNDASLNELSRYYFDGRGKSFRPRLAAAMAQAVNAEFGIPPGGSVYYKQLQVSVICEMYHTASLAHDDVLDKADLRRGKVSLNRLCGQKNSIWAGNYTMAIANKIVGQTGNNEVASVMLNILSDLVVGELQQMAAASKSNIMDHYLMKSYNKTASLIEKACKAVAILSASEAKLPASDKKVESAIISAKNYGKNIGMAFQLIDDWLDFTASVQQLGKPSGASDLKLGLATAPVIFAASTHPELNVLIQRKFSEPGDVEEAFDKVVNSDGLNETLKLASCYSNAAVQNLSSWKDSSSKEVLVEMANAVVNRNK